MIIFSLDKILRAGKLSVSVSVSLYLPKQRMKCRFYISPLSFFLSFFLSLSFSFSALYIVSFTLSVLLCPCLFLRRVLYSRLPSLSFFLSFFLFLSLGHNIVWLMVSLFLSVSFNSVGNTPHLRVSNVPLSSIPRNLSPNAS